MRTRQARQAGPSGITEAVARFAATASGQGIPEADRAVARRAILDCLGVTLAGSTTELGRILVDRARAASGAGDAGVIAGGMRTAPALAALTNGALARALDFDDVSAFGHASAILLPAILGVGPPLGRSGRDCVDAYLIGHEVALALHRGCGSSPVMHESPIYGVMGATAAAARLAGLDAERTGHALGIAASGAAGVRANLDGQAGALHAGQAAQAAVTACELAARGVTAVPDVIEHPAGFAATFATATPDLARIPEGLGEVWHVSAELSFKQFPCAFALQGPVHTLLELLRELEIDEDDVGQVRLSPERPVERADDPPRTAAQARRSPRYVLAAALLDGRLDRESFKPGRLHGAKLHDAMQRIRVESPSRVSAVLGRVRDCRARLEIAHHAGTLVRRDIGPPPGHAGNPWSDESVERKFLDNARGVLSDDAARAVLETVRRLDQVEHIGDVVDVLTCPTGVHPAAARGGRTA